jgi:hypothetical protein
MEVMFMRRLSAATVSLVALGLAVGLGAASSTAPRPGSLVGQTQISFGCPGPIPIGQPSCHPWHPLPHAGFTIRRVGPTGRPLSQVVRLVVSDSKARFAVRLVAGSYIVTPLAQPHTQGGSSLTVHVRPGRVTRVLVRYRGYPQMA